MEPVVAPMPDAVVSGNRVLDRTREEVGSAQQTPVVASLSRDLSRSPQSIMRYLEATAMLCRQGQDVLLQEVLTYVETVCDRLCPVAFLFHQTVDETPLKVRVKFEGMDNQRGQLAKVFVAESSWSMLLRDSSTASRDEAHDEDTMHKQHLFIFGAWAPVMRASNNASATAIAGIFESCPQPGEQVARLFKHKIRVLECDENPANLKASRIWKEMADQNWSEMVWLCSAHKTHTISDKTMSLCHEAMSGTVNVLLSMHSTMQLNQLQRALDAYATQ